MDYFSEIPEGQAIVMTRGVYRQVKLYERGGKVYARHGSGLVKLSQGGSTSAMNVRWMQIDPGDGGYKEERGSVFYIPPIVAAAE